MHVPDGFINAPVSVCTGVVAAAGVALSLRGARRELDERTAPLAGLVAAFVFAAQMLNFPVGAGTSGHLLGGALAAILVGPYTGALCITVVLMVQALFADGGLTALGTNITLMGLITAAVGYGVFRLVLSVLPRRPVSVTAAAFLAAAISVPVAAGAFTVVFALGGTESLPIGKVAAAMVGVHLLIGLGEAAITALTVAAVLAVRPDLVRGARGMLPKAELADRREGAVQAMPAGPCIEPLASAQPAVESPVAESPSAESPAANDRSGSAR